MDMRFIQVHTLHSYPAALLNRDEAGMAKRMPFGNAMRTRVSSQCLKRAWRTGTERTSLRNLKVPGAYRSRNTIAKMVTEPLARQPLAPDGEVLEAVENALNLNLYGRHGANQADRQMLLLGEPEIAYLQEAAAAVCADTDDPKQAAAKVDAMFAPRSDSGRNFQAMQANTRMAAGIEGAMFGRMMTSNPRANIDAAIHVAHAFTVHEEQSEIDYFTALDDLADTSAGSVGHIGESEIASGIYYGYVVVDVPQLVSNLEGCAPHAWRDADRTLGAEVVKTLLHLIATVTPGGKLAATAPYTYAEFMLCEAGDGQPRTLANAFRDPVPARMTEAARTLGDYMERMDAAYAYTAARRCMAMFDCEVQSAPAHTLQDLAGWVADRITANDAG